MHHFLLPFNFRDISFFIAVVVLIVFRRGIVRPVLVIFVIILIAYSSLLHRICCSLRSHTPRFERLFFELFVIEVCKRRSRMTSTRLFFFSFFFFFFFCFFFRRQRIANFGIIFLTFRAAQTSTSNIAATTTTATAP